jgi:hypothetical protein
MDPVTRLRVLPVARQLIGGAAALLVIDLFLDWQQACLGPFCASRSGWHGFGVLVGLAALATLGWEGVRAFGRPPALPIAHDQASAALAALTALLTLILFLDHNEARHWPAWIGLLLAVALAVGAVGVLSPRDQVEPLQG